MHLKKSIPEKKGVKIVMLMITANENFPAKTISLLINC